MEEEITMRSRLWILATVAALLAAIMMAGCGASGVDPATPTPAPVKTLRPTFTHTPAQPTEPPATATPEIPPTATPEPATPTPEVPPTETAVPASATPEAASLTVTSQTANLRSGPGTGFGRVGQVSSGETYEVTGKNQAGDWWEIDFDGKAAWIYSQMATVARPELVALAEKIPTAAPRPTARPAPKPAPAQPAPAPAPAANVFYQSGLESRNADEANFGVVTFWGRLGKTAEGDPYPGGYKLKVAGPTGTMEVPFRDVWEMAYSGQRSSEFRYNAKIELPRGSGGFNAVVLDPSGKQVSDPISGTLIDRTHDVIMTWWKR